MDRQGIDPNDPVAMRLPFVGVENVESESGAFNFGNGSRIGNQRSTTFRFDERHVLYAKLRPYLNKVATPGFAGRCSTELVPLLPRNGVDREFIAYLLRRKETVEYVMTAVTGSRMPRTDMKALLSLPVSIPPLDEQRRIVGILNRAAKIERLQARAADCLQQFIPALFIKMFGDAMTNPMGWTVSPLKDISDIAAGDPAPQGREAFTMGDYPFVRMQDVGRDHINPALSNTKDRLGENWLGNHRLRRFPKGSILIPKSGASIDLNHRAMLAVEACVVSHLAVVIPDKSKIDPVWLFWWSVQYDPRHQAQLTSLPSLKLVTLKQAPVPVPPLEQQRRFASLAGQAARLAVKVQTAADTAAALSASLMDRLLNR